MNYCPSDKTGEVSVQWSEQLKQDFVHSVELKQDKILETKISQKSWSFLKRFLNFASINERYKFHVSRNSFPCS